MTDAITLSTVADSTFDGCPLVSISCITYNQAQYIRECLDGFLMQKVDFPVEILIHDDCSTDGTDNIIREYTEKYPNIIKPIFEVENQYQNGKPFGARIWNYPRAQGKYIAFCEGDDYWTDPYKLKKQIEFLEGNPDYGMCYTDCDSINVSTGKVTQSILNTRPLTEPRFKNAGDFIVGREYAAPPSWVFRRDLYLSYNDQVKSVDGTFVWFAYFLAVSKVHYIPESTVMYRVLGESASHSRNFEKMYAREKNLLETQIKLIDLYQLDPKYKKECIEHHYRYNLIDFALNNKQDDVSRAKQILQHVSTKQHIILLVASSSVGRIILKKVRAVLDKTLH